MEFRDLKKQYQVLKKEIDQSIDGVLNQCNFISGAPVTELEETLSEYVGVKHCITCANGTDALTMALMAWGIKKGDAVFVPDFTFFASGEVVAFLGATPVFYDVDINTYNADPISLEKAIKAVIEEGVLTPKVIMTVDLFGQPADYKKIQAIADKYQLLLLEDGAQGFGGRIGEQKACSFGDISTTSFFPAKPLGCYGDGGAIFTNDDQIADYLKSIRIHGKGKDKYDNIRIGWNSRLDTLQAAILSVKFKAFKDYELEKINFVAEQYNNLLNKYVTIPYIQPNMLSSWAQYTIQVESEKIREELRSYLNQKKIPSMIYYPKSMGEQKAFSTCRKYVSCENSNKICKQVLSLPIHPYMEKEDVIEVSHAIATFFEKEN